MNWIQALYLSPVFMAVILSALLAVFTWRRRPATGAIPLTLTMFFTAEWSLFYILELLAPTLQEKFFWESLEYIGVVAIPVTWLMFALQYSGRERWINPTNVSLICLIPVLTLLFFWTTPQWGWMRREMWLADRGPFTVIGKTYGPWFWISLAYNYMLILIGTALLVQTLLRSTRLYRNQRILLITGGLLPMITNALIIFGLNPLPGIDLTPAAFALSGALVALGMFRYQLLDIYPVARDAVMESMADPVIVLNAANYIVDINPAALRYLERTLPQVIGLRAAQVFSAWDHLVERYTSSLQADDEVELIVQGKTHYFDLHISPLYDLRQRFVGRLIALRDITQRKQAEQALHRLNEVLEDRVQERTRQLFTLNRTGQTLSRILTPAQIFETAYQAASDMLAARSFFIALLNTEKNLLYFPAYWIEQQSISPPSRPLGNGFFEYILRKKSPLCVPDQMNEALALLGIDTPKPLPRSLLAVPMLSGEQVLGVMGVQDLEQEGVFSSRQVEWLSTLSSQVVVALENARLVATAQQELGERQQAVAALKESEERYFLAMRGANDGLWDWNLKNNSLYYSPRWKSMLGYEENEVGNTLSEWFVRVHPDDIERLNAEILAHLQNSSPDLSSEYRVLHKDGEYRWVMCRGLAVRDANGTAYRMAGSMTDITIRKRAEEQIIYDAFHDSLTGLPNRALFQDRLGRAIEHNRRNPADLFAVIYLDFDRFKLVNDSLGHSIGDQLLVASARRLENCIRSSDTVARLGGDEFVILLEDVAGEADARMVADRVLNDLSLPYHLGGHQVFSSASIGLVLSIWDYERPEEVLRDADIAMYRAKLMGKARTVLFTPEMREMARDRLELETDLREAIDQQQFRLHYQPIVDLNDGRLIGFEALARWAHPRRGLMLPLDFIPLAEETGLIIPIGHWVMREACQQARFWQEQYPLDPPLTISINLSARQFTQVDLCAVVEGILEETGLPGHTLSLEITESVLVENRQAASELLQGLRGMGIHVQIDDFGTGYSSLSYLHQFPIDTLKIDRSFVEKLSYNGETNTAEIIRTIMTLARELDLKVIAEGLETSKQLSRLLALQCEYGQGFYFSEPVENTEAEALIAKSRLTN